MSSQPTPGKTYLDDATSAIHAVSSLASGAPPARAITARLSSDWRSVAAAAAKGQSEVDRAVKAISKRELAIGTSIRRAFDVAQSSQRIGENSDDIATIPITSAKPRLITRPISDFDMEPTEYLCEPYLPRGYLILLASNGGEGKSLLSLQIAADLSMGRPCLGSAASVDGPVHTILIAAEDKVTDGIKPRFVAAGGDVNYLHVEEGVRDGNSIRPFDLTYVGSIRDSIEDHRRAVRNVKFLIIDPINNYMGRVDTHKDSDLKVALRDLTDLASAMDVTILCLTHLNKPGKGPTANANSRVMGGAGFVNTARLVYQYWKDPEDANRRIFVCTKFNMPDKPPPLMVSVAVIPQLEAEALLAPHCTKLPDEKRRKLATQLRRLTIEAMAEDVCAEDLMNAEKPATRGPKPTATIARATWLFNYLKEQAGPVPVTSIYDAAGEEGHLRPLPNPVGTKKWVSVDPVYMAKNHIPKLNPPDDGYVVEESKEGVRSFWRLAKVGDSDPSEGSPF
jgi:hypothetical protein